MQKKPYELVDKFGALSVDANRGRPKDGEVPETLSMVNPSSHMFLQTSIEFGIFFEDQTNMMNHMQTTLTIMMAQDIEADSIRIKDMEVNSIKI